MKRCLRAQFGATAVEFALVLLLLLMFLFGILDLARMLFTWSAAAEASRNGARYASVCMGPGGDPTKLMSIMQSYLPQITTSSYTLTWGPKDSTGAACTTDNCKWVRLDFTDLHYQWIAPIPGFTPLADMLMPNLSTTVPAEVMGTDANSAELCK